jgi:hypothetical protein
MQACATAAIARRLGPAAAALAKNAQVSIRQHTLAYVSIRQHTSAYVSIRQPLRRLGPRALVLAKMVLAKNAKAEEIIEWRMLSDVC